MARSSTSLLCFTLFSLLLSHACFAQIEQMPQRSQRGGQQRQQHRWQSQCQFQRLNARQPNRRVECEAGVSEYWDIQNTEDDELHCAGVETARHTIQRRGLLLPSFLNAPMMFYVIQGRGIHGAVIPGCPETFERGTSSPSSRGYRSEGASSDEQHQKVREIKEGDMVAMPAGVADWVYNNGDSPLVLIAFVDVGNQANQLDQFSRRFHLAGNPHREQKTQQQVRARSQSRSQLRRESGEQTPNGNIFSGFDTRILAESFNVDTELAHKLQNRDDMRERIVRVRGEDLQIIAPSRIQEEERRHYSRDNGLEETFCTLRLRQNIDRPSQADIFNPRGGRLNTLNNYNLPILRFLQLTAERGVLYKNGMMAPHFNLDSHSVIYVTRGSARLQVVDDNGRNVFDGELREGQIFVVPQNFAVVKKASAQGFEWIAVKTNDNAMRNPLAGKVSAMRAMPDDVLANAFQISREQARRLKYGRDEISVFSPSSQQTRYE
ncbi:11S globulin subunit beta [Cannabis sativa]|uniref:11S seed storage protein n=1 Tax=Cannabis sativa TaxID=3483 RepID=A0A090CXP8_CANSA|nr:11S globulin subunit beta [Cannabis sativa]XP_030507981.1 11S globulin subunit beta [Cannabis sativa]CDP79029.1 edestin 2 [Cannabis sativa]SNQ45155.1 edestin 2 [Cannabis sativa]SNQ45156.1 edestin 2 [Cannabis sativa]